MNSKHVISRGSGLALIATLALLIILSPGSAAAETEASRWSALGAGVNKYVNALALRGAYLYVGGAFTKAGGNPAKRMAEWDTTSKEWENCGDGVNNDVLVLLPKGKKIYVGLNFGGGLKTWHTKKEKWATVGGGVQGMVSALALVGNDLYVGGMFDTVGGNVTAHNIAKYNLTTKTWSPVGKGVDGPVWTIAPVASGLVFLGGEFTHVYGSSTELNHVAAWDGTGFQTLGTGVNGPVYAMTPHHDTVVFVGGAFTQAGGAPANALAVWHQTAPQSWEEWGGGVSGGTYMGSTFVWTILVHGEDAYVGGSFQMAGGTTAASNIVKRDTDAQTWSALGSGLNNVPWALAYSPQENALYVGGEFTQAGGKAAAHVARWRVQ